MKVTKRHFYQLDVSMLFLLASIVASGLKLFVLGYLLSSISFLFILPLLEWRKIYLFNKRIRLVWLLLCGFNAFLLLQMLFTSSNYSLYLVFLSPYFAQSVLVFLYILVDNSFFPHVCNRVENLLPIAAIALFVDYQICVPLIIIYSMFLFVFPDIIQKNKTKRLIIWLVLVLASLYLVTRSARFHGMAIGVFFILAMATSLFPRMYKFFWSCTILLPFVFAITLFVYGFSIFDASSYSDKTSNGDVMNDTRSFLYIEATETLIEDNALTWGKGILGRVTTIVLKNNDETVDGEGGRQFVETNILELIRRGGLVYLGLYVLLFGICSYCSLNSSNQYVRNMGLLLATVFFFSLIDIPVFMEPLTICYMLFLGLTADEMIMKLNDKDLKFWIENHK